MTKMQEIKKEARLTSLDVKHSSHSKQMMTTMSDAGSPTSPQDDLQNLVLPMQHLLHSGLPVSLKATKARVRSTTPDNFDYDDDKNLDEVFNAPAISSNGSTTVAASCALLSHFSPVQYPQDVDDDEIAIKSSGLFANDGSGGKKCRKDGCENSARSRGLCPAHGGGTRCRVANCTKHVVSSGKCVSHGGGRRCKTPNCSSSAVSRGLCVLHGGGRKCKQQGCTKHVASGGLCRVHGGGRRCKMESCNSSAQSRGLCYVHGGGGRCQMKDCSSSAKKGGFCIAHGGGHRCQVPNCTSSAVSGDLCRAHGGGKRCSVEDCKSSAKTGGLCIAHGGGKRCTVEGCRSSAQRMGLCKSHGGGRKCTVENCSNSAVSRGKCIAHGGGKRCVYEGCTTTARKGGYCFAHGGRSHNNIGSASSGSSSSSTPTAYQAKSVSAPVHLFPTSPSTSWTRPENAPASPLIPVAMPLLTVLPPMTSLLTPRNDGNRRENIVIPPLRSRSGRMSYGSIFHSPMKAVHMHNTNISSNHHEHGTASPKAKPTGYSWQKLQETIRRESKIHGINGEEADDMNVDEDDNVDTLEEDIGQEQATVQTHRRPFIKLM